MKRFAILLSALGVGSIVVLGQQPAPAQSGPLFRSGVDYVSVDVVVTDKNDKPVTDLKKDDFTIIENSKPQTIRDFQFVSIPMIVRTVDVSQPAPPPPPDVATNMPPSPKSRLFAIVIDDLHIIEQNYVQMKAMLTDLVNAMSPDDEVAVVFTGRSDMGVNFTTDRGSIMKPIERIKDALGFGEDALGSVFPPGSQPMSSTSTQVIPASAPSKTQETLNHARSSVFTLRNVAASLAGSGNARRAIFFVSSGIPLDQNAPINPGAVLSSAGVSQTVPTPSEFSDAKTVRDELDDAYAEAQRADVPIYTIDPRGLVLRQNSMRGDGFQYSEDVFRKAIQVQQNYLAEIAVNTGGRALMNQSDLKKAVEEVIQENGSYYTLGYSPDPLVRDGKFHPISVKVSRPGLIVRPRKGYVAPSSTPASTDAKPMLDKAIGAGVNMSGIQLRAFVAPVALATNGMNAAVTVELRYPAPDDRSTNITDNFEMTVVALDADGKIKATSARTLHFSTSPPDTGNTVTFLIDDAIVLPSQPLTLRIGVASQTLGTVGTVQLPVDVPKAADGKLHLGEVVVGFADFLREAALQADRLRGLVPLQPTTARSFSAKDTLRIFDRLFWGSKDADADVSITIAGAAGRAPIAAHVTGAPSTINSSRREGVLDVKVPLAGLAAGSYVLKVEAKLASGQTAVRDVVFEVK